MFNNKLDNWNKVYSDIEGSKDKLSIQKQQYKFEEDCLDK